MADLTQLLAQVRACTLCEQHLPSGPRPILQMAASAKILIAGQAPGRKVHESGVPFDDASGDRLREWLGLSSEQFYDEKKVAILPMGFCFPGTGKSGDLPPRKECATTWRQALIEHLPHLEFTVLIGHYAQQYYFEDKKTTVTQRVKDWRTKWPSVVSLPHPSPRNNIWLAKNAWFAEEVLPELKLQVKEILEK
jgi:uracil-DNA glycosylase